MQGGRKRWIVWTVATIFGIGLLAIVYAAPYQHIRVSMCPICGSTLTDTTWFAFIHQQHKETSPLETWLVKRQPTFVPKCQVIADDQHALFTSDFTDYHRPQIGRIAPFLDTVIKNESEDKINRLVSTLKN